MNYAAEYDAYWTRGDRVGESSGYLEQTADDILLACGRGAILDVGSGEGALVRALLDRGVDATGIDVSEVVVARCNQRAPGRFFHGSVLSLPFESESFETVVSTDCMEHLAPEDIPSALREIYRVARRNVFLKIATTQDRDNHWHLTVEGRSWWEARCFEAGFRKHPSYYKVNSYEALNADGWQVCILLEKLPLAALEKYPLSSLDEERGLHMDMLRDGGERSDAHVIRYHWACGYIKRGDRVLDAACGLGYGGRVMRHNTRAARIVGVDGSDYAVDYANKSFPDSLGRLEYQVGMLPEALSDFEDGSFDAIVSFETLEHVSHPKALLSEFHRLLAPGGRLLVSVPNDWSDESGEDPNPYHLHVYDWRRLKAELAENFVLEEAYAQTASQCKVLNDGRSVWERRQRSLRKVEITQDAQIECEWWLMVAMKSPVAQPSQYSERVFSNIASTSHPSIRYDEYFAYPCLMHAMVNVTYRLKNAQALAALAEEVLEISPKGSNDHLAALCVMAYHTLEQPNIEAARVHEVIRLVNDALELAMADLMGFRWKISLLFVKGKLLQSIGDLENAKASYVECGSHDVRAFGVHLATKTTEACFVAGKIACSLSNLDDARACWQRSIDIGTQLLAVSVDDILINRSHPNIFNHGDGVREYATAWDNIARCANGLHLLADGEEVDERLLQGSFQNEYAIVTRDIVSCRDQLDATTLQLVEDRRALAERTGLLEKSNDALQALTQEVVDTRSILEARTSLLEQCDAQLLMRTAELVRTREELVERTQLVERCNRELEERTKLLLDAGTQLGERTELLERANQRLENLTEELVEARQVGIDRTGRLEDLSALLGERTDLLERANDLLERQTHELIDVRKMALDRTARLEEMTSELGGRTQLLERANDRLESLTLELIEARKLVVDRTAHLEHVASELVERTELLGRANSHLEGVTRELVELRSLVAERTELLEHVNAKLRERTALLEGVNSELMAAKLQSAEAQEALEIRDRLLAFANSEVARLSQGTLKRFWRRMRGGL